MKPYPFQVADLEKLRKHNYRGLVNAGTGVGKTATGLFAAREGGAGVTLVIAHADSCV